MTVLLGLMLITHICVGYSVMEETPCALCKCVKDVIDCSVHNFTVIPNFTNLQNKTTKLIIRGNDISHVTLYPKIAIISLVLSQNRITQIDDSAFSNLYNLSVLDLSYNLLTSDKLVPGIFRGHYAADSFEPLWALKKLILDHNMLDTLHPNVFEHTPNLEVLSLSGNPLKLSNFDTIKAISVIPHLKTLNLSNTKLTKLPDHFLQEPKHLEQLDLSKNAFSEPPMALENVPSIKWLSLSANLMKTIRKFPRLPSLRVLHLSNMKYLSKIESGSLSTLTALEEFHCVQNPKLTDIDSNTFSSRTDDEEGESWPPIRLLNLSNNKIRYLDRHLIGQWRKLSSIDLTNNPWVCDCENQWLISVLVSIIRTVQKETLPAMKCKEPIEMEGKVFTDLQRRHYQMRCLDIYDHRPENDGLILIFVLIGVLLVTPLVVIIVLYYRRLNRTPDYYRKTLFSKLEEELDT